MGLKEYVHKRLLESGLDKRDVAERLGCSVQWVRDFERGRIKGPSVDKIESLYLILTGKQLEIGD